MEEPALAHLNRDDQPTHAQKSAHDARLGEIVFGDRAARDLVHDRPLSELCVARGIAGKDRGLKGHHPMRVSAVGRPDRLPAARVGRPLRPCDRRFELLENKRQIDVQQRRHHTRHIQNRHR